VARYETILIDAESMLDGAARQVAALVGSRPKRGTDATGADYWSIELPSGVVGWVATADYEDDRGMPLSQYRFEIDIGDPEKDVARQESAARELYDRLVASTDWPLLLTFNDLQRRVDSREIKPVARQRP